MDIVLSIISIVGTITGIFVGFRLNSEFSKEENQKNITATLISQNRMEWIQNVRKHSADFTAQVEDLHLLRNEIFLHSLQKDEEKLDSIENEVNKKRHILMLNFGMDEENKEILELIDQLTKLRPIQYMEHKDDLKACAVIKFMDDSEMKIESFIEKMRVYLNTQWRRAKKLDIGNTDFEEFEKKDLESYKDKYKIKSVNVKEYIDKGISL